MSLKIPRPILAALVAPLLGTVLSSGAALAAGGDTACDAGPIVIGPVSPPMVEMYPSDPTIAPPVPAVEEPSDPAAQPPLVAPEASVEPMPAPLTDLEDADFADFDLSAGLATNFGGGGATSLAFADAPVAPGYIESAAIQSRVRIRYDNAQNANRPTRAGFMYPTPFEGSSLDYTGGRGPAYNGGTEPVVDMEELAFYFEWALRDRFSVFFNAPIRWVDPVDVRATFNGNGGTVFNGNDDENSLTQRGAGDMSAGFRWGWIACPDQHLTVQLRTTVPTGEARRAIGTGNTTIDVGLLYDRRLSDRSWFFAELNDWQTLDAVTLVVPDPALQHLASQDANILRYGVGLGYDIARWSKCRERRSITLLAECVGWSVLDGVTAFVQDAPGLVDATGDSIVNGKYGVRYNHGKHSLYAGYGHNWTSDRWYSDLRDLSGLVRSDVRGVSQFGSANVKAH